MDSQSKGGTLLQGARHTANRSPNVLEPINNLYVYTHYCPSFLTHLLPHPFFCLPYFSITLVQGSVSSSLFVDDQWLIRRKINGY